MLDNLDYNTYVLMGDGEIAEGAVWEAASLAGYYKLNNLIAIVDANRLGQSEATAFGHHIEIYRDRFEAFGWRVEDIDGHDIEEIAEVLGGVGLDDKPLAIIAKTYKGAGISFLQDKDGWHGKPLNKEEAAQGDRRTSAQREVRPRRRDSCAQQFARSRPMPFPRVIRRSITSSATRSPRAKPMAPRWRASAKRTCALLRWTATRKIPRSRTNFSKNFRNVPPNVSSPNKTWSASRPV